MYKNSRNISSTCFLWINQWKVKFSQLLWTGFCMPCSSPPHTKYLYIESSFQVPQNVTAFGGWVLKRYVRAKSLQSCPTLWDPMDCTLPGFSVHEILQARILEWIAMSSRSLPNPGIEPVSLTSLALAGGFFTIRATWEAPLKRWLS